MADLGVTFDATTVDPSSTRELLPAGKYLMQIVNSEMKDTNAGDGRYLSLEMDILDGPLSGRKIWDRLNLVNPNPQAVEISQRTLSAICHATGKLSVSNSEQIHFLPMLVTVKVKPAGNDKKGVWREASNEIGGYDGVNGAARSAANTQAARPAAQVGAPVTKAAAPPWKRQAA